MKLKQLPDAMRDRQVSDGEICLWYLGQEGFAFKSSRTLLLIDPYLTDSIDRDPNGTPGFQRLYPPPATPKSLSFADYILCTHDHQDHFDPESIAGLDSGRNIFCLPKPSAQQAAACGIPADRQILLENERPAELTKIRVIPVAAAHDKLTQCGGAYCALSYILQFENGLTVFHGGDMVIYPGLEETVAAYRPQIAFLPINGRCYYRDRANIIGNISFREAADFAHRIGAQMLVPMHYDLYALNGENPTYFVDYVFHKYPELKFHLFRPGEAMTLNRQDWE